MTQHAAMQNTFVMLYIDNFSQWNKLDPKTQRENSTEMNVTTVNHQTNKKGLSRCSLTLS